MDYLKAAASYLDRSNISSNYTTINSPSATTSSTSSANEPTSSNAASHWSPPTRIGLWTVHRAIHNSSNKLVSIWTAEKRLESSPSSSLSSLPSLVTVANSWASGSISNSSSASNPNQPKTPLEKVIEILKKEVSSLSRLRHPCILEVVEPLEETRSTMVFATEPITGSLKDGIEQPDRRSNLNHPSRSHPQINLELDEVETQKGLLQIGKGLQFLHESAKLVHCNLTPEAIIINAKPDGQDTKWVFPQYDHRLPESVQRNFDYLAPEYCLDEQLSTSNDIGPPFQNHCSLDRIRNNVENLGVLSASWSRVPDDVKEVLSQLVTRTPSTRLVASAFLNSRYFSSNLLVSTLAFLDRDTFNSKQKEEHVQFMKGLLRILPQFSSKVVKQKILPSLIEECRKHVLLPFLLPNIFFIAQQMESEEFRSELLPHLTRLFSIKDPPQNILILLDNLSVFETKTTPQVFREDVMPLIYVALESDLPTLQEKALKVIPGLCETLEMVFSKTTLLSVKVNTLICFHSMVKILDKYTLTEKLVPLLSRIKTKEPAVMIATLAVHEEMGKKVELTAIATLILPQLWAMSIGPLLNIDQFNRFMNSIDQLTKRVRQEHTRHLVEAKRLEETTACSSSTQPSLNHSGSNVLNEAVDFENLVKGPKTWPSSSSSNPPIQQDAVPVSPSANSAWGFDDPFGNLNSGNLSTSAIPLNRHHSNPVVNLDSRKSAALNVSNELNQSRSSNSLRSYPSMFDNSHGRSTWQASSRLDSLGAQQRPHSLASDLPQNPPPSSSTSQQHSTFVGLPPLVPQTSSLTAFAKPSSSSTYHSPQAASTAQTLKPSWNVIPPVKPSQNLNPGKPLNSKMAASLADFDPFA
ncbi:SCY1 protein kinase [Puccinia sorghi]|uniref:SCY1 protein kinase n=1 Tax=Puccinia sorghi TaxID=27349 RepID=A0A0L6V9Z3_9BASI|nr:SCY1 protein kinase [Puccinia sorghi]